MKKLAIIAVLATMACAASAADIGLRFGRNYSTETNSTGIVVGQKFGAFGAEAAFDRTVGVMANDRYSLVGSYGVAKVAGATVALKAGVGYVATSSQVAGYTALAGVGISYPLTKSINLVADYAFQTGQDRVNAYNGGNVTAGVKYAF